MSKAVKPAEVVRFNQAIEYLKGEHIVKDKKDLSEKLNYTNAHLAVLTSGSKMLPERLLSRLEEQFGISSKWIKMGEGQMVKGKRAASGNYISDNTIYHVPQEKVSGLSKYLASDKFYANLKRWCVPGLIGDFISVTLDTKSLEPDYPKGAILVLKEQEDAVLISDNCYVILKNDNVIFAARVMSNNGGIYTLNKGKLKQDDILKSYIIVLGVPPANR